MRFRNRVVLVTGSSKGWAGAWPKHSWARAPRVVIHGRNAETLAQCVAELREAFPEATACGAEVVGIAGDIADSAIVNSLFEQLLAKFGTLDTGQ